MEVKETIDDTLTLKAGIPVITAQSYRLEKIRDIQNVIEEERNKRATLSKNYNKAVKIIKTTTDILGLITMALGVSGIGVLSTVVSAPIAIGMEGIALAAGVIIIIASQVNKKISFKGEKHEKIKVLAEAKINTISDLISKALEDGEISDNEYSLILRELDKFNEMKETIRSRIREQIDVETIKQPLIIQDIRDKIKPIESVSGT